MPSFCVQMQHILFLFLIYIKDALLQMYLATVHNREANQIYLAFDFFFGKSTMVLSYCYISVVTSGLCTETVSFSKMEWIKTMSRLLH